ncbi:uncharacterized protein B0P05DRAFT_584942 [Gilbertella persicaria]|uniref:Uncharacterized protein n=1 Tax=Rhizopus stolonifer TaxID=4846 RepID=A0A367KKP5_RHIST|nr:uncharacterized protein B0P05DRAFT_584942 [Gilbertella persicaria]KAI8087719.1 hypothetical protein B0P05DRAFT_584942 [Gilbertella persicaria]RCI02422.1 hypothetical protein CU098_012367 [Rhizopus stolonifer]
MDNSQQKDVPDWSLRLTEQLLSPHQIPPSVTQPTHNRLSETSSKATTLRNSTYFTKKTDPPIQHQDEESNVWWVTKNDQDGFYSVGGLLFLFGFLCPPLWWIGSFWPRHVREKGGKMADRWQKLNRIMSLGFSSILLILIIVFVVLYATHSL